MPGTNGRAGRLNRDFPRRSSRSSDVGWSSMGAWSPKCRRISGDRASSVRHRGRFRGRLRSIHADSGQFSEIVSSGLSGPRLAQFRGKSSGGESLFFTISTPPRGDGRGTGGWREPVVVEAHRVISASRIEKLNNRSANRPLGRGHHNARAVMLTGKENREGPCPRENT